MKKTIAVFLAVSVLAAGVPVMAAESIQEKVSRLNNEITKGASSHTGAEVKKLELKLKEAQETLNVLQQGG